MPGHIGEIATVAAHQVIVRQGIPIITCYAVRPPDRRDEAVIDKVVQRCVHRPKGNARPHGTNGIVDFRRRWVTRESCDGIEHGAPMGRKTCVGHWFCYHATSIAFWE
ncbi:MAG: hypothetical protein JWO59_1874 [Chloroflexi bacterium]|nr:hypothetical protein [Chloroflexota bacterium]